MMDSWTDILKAMAYMRTNPASLICRYSFVGLASLFKDFLLTKLSYPQARLMRRPIYLRGRRWMKIGKGFTCGPGLRMDAFPQSPTKEALLRIGADVQMNDYVHIAAAKSVIIGDRVLIASKVFISDHDHGCYSGSGPQDSPLTPPAERSLCCLPVVIEDDVWIGEFVAVLPGVTIGRGSIIGTHSTVTKSVPAYSIAVGSPARVMKQYNFVTKTWEPV